MNIYYDFTKLDEALGCAPTDPIEIPSPEQLEFEKITDGSDHPNWKGGITQDKEYWKEYMREYSKKRYTEKKNDPKFIQDKNRRRREHYQENKEKTLEKNKQWILNNPEKRKAHRNKWYHENKDRINAKRKEKRDLQKQLQEIT